MDEFQRIGALSCKGRNTQSLVDAPASLFFFAMLIPKSTQILRLCKYFSFSYLSSKEMRILGFVEQRTLRVHSAVLTPDLPSSPFPGAATGSGGEIRDEGAVGRGSRPKAGLCGFTVSDLHIPDFEQPWELDVGRPGHIASSLDIMLEAPIGSAAFNNEFGRPCTTGYFRTLLTRVPVDKGNTEIRGYHKPIMIAGGVGTVRPQHALKNPDLVPIGAHLIVIGGPGESTAEHLLPF